MYIMCTTYNARNIILKSKELEGTETQDLGDDNNAQDLGDIPF